GNEDIVITNNRFASWEQSIYGTSFVGSVISGNHFYPGAWIAHIGGSQGGANQLEISGNIFDGRVTQYSGQNVGFRATWFEPRDLPHQRVLYAGNQVFCVGTRPGYNGAAFGTDTMGSPAGLRSAQLLKRVSQQYTTTQLVVSSDAMNFPSAAS